MNALVLLLGAAAVVSAGDEDSGPNAVPEGPYLGPFPDWAPMACETHMSYAMQLLLWYADHAGTAAAEGASKRFVENLARVAGMKAKKLQSADGPLAPRALLAFSHYAGAQLYDREKGRFQSTVRAATARLARVSEEMLLPPWPAPPPKGSGGDASRNEDAGQPRNPRDDPCGLPRAGGGPIGGCEHLPL